MELEKQLTWRIAIGMYANEPCRICGDLLTMDDVIDGAVFAGYSKNNTSRAAHKACWDARKNDKANWTYSEDAQP